MTLDELQQSAVDAPADALLLLTGIAGTGKTTALAARARALAAAGKRVFAGAPHAAPRNRLRALLAGTGCEIATVESLACRLLGEAVADQSIEIIDSVDASIVFERVAEPLFLMEWAEFLEAQIDPEVPGLRAPQRFLEAAFRLIGKLRNAQIAPAHFLDTALKGAARFYAQPPNLAHPDLIAFTKEKYRGSLDVDARELQRQHRREVDLAKILAKLYASYLELLIAKGCYTGPDAVAEITQRLLGDEGLRARLAARFDTALVDDAQALSGGELAFMQALWGEGLPCVTLAGDQTSATGTFSGARPDKVFALPATRIALEREYRCAPAIARAARHIAGMLPPPAAHQGGSVTLFRATTRRAEAAFIADHIAALVNAGTDPQSIALLFRSVESVEHYETELLNRNIDVTVSGNLNLFAQPDVLDALALLWNVHDPFAHEWLLRTLSGRALGLSDASVVALCSDSGSAQPLLFAEIEEATDRRWDRNRDLRLGWNVMHGAADAHLTEFARERVTALRARLQQWQRDRCDLELVPLAVKIFNEGLAAAGPQGSAALRHQVRGLRRLIARIEQFAQRYPDGTLGDFLAYAEQRRQSTLEACEEPLDGGTVRILDLTSAMGAEFDHVFLPNVRAGSFPRYYVPDAFLYSPSMGMIAKENAGDARASRTAKFSYYVHRMKTTELYNAEERRAFVYALRRARKAVYVTASEKSTRGLTTPEFLTELQAARVPGSVDLSDHWRPSHTTVA